jgi:hypothetical protein
MNSLLWQPGLQLGQPDRLLGYMVETWEQMDNIALNAHPIAFGDFRQAPTPSLPAGRTRAPDPSVQRPSAALHTGAEARQ